MTHFIIFNILTYLHLDPVTSFHNKYFVRVSYICYIIGAYCLLILLTWIIWWAPNNASKWQMGFKSVFKGLSSYSSFHVPFPQQTTKLCNLNNSTQHSPKATPVCQTGEDRTSIATAGAPKAAYSSPPRDADVFLFLWIVYLTTISAIPTV
jgi:hypothetical protein